MTKLIDFLKKLELAEVLVGIFVIIMASAFVGRVIYNSVEYIKTPICSYKDCDEKCAYVEGKYCQKHIPYKGSPYYESENNTSEKRYICIKLGCYNYSVSGSMYCNEHKSQSKTYSGSNKTYSSGSSKNYSSGGNKITYNYHDTVKSYDSGYDDVYYDDWYDEERYYSDPDYAEGVDAAMDEFGW